MTPEQVAENAKNGTQGHWEVPDQTWTKSLTVNTAGGMDATMIACAGSQGAVSYTDEICTMSWKDDGEWLYNAKRIASVPDMEALIAEQAAQLAAANARIAELEGALEPFAKAGGLFNDHFISLVYDPAAGDEYRLNSSHLIAARAALSQTDKGEG